MTQHQRRVVVDKVEQAMAVQVDQVDAFARIRVQGERVHMHAGPTVAAREGLLGACKHLLGVGVARHVIGNLLIERGL